MSEGAGAGRRPARTRRATWAWLAVVAGAVLVALAVASWADGGGAEPGPTPTVTAAAAPLEGCDGPDGPSRAPIEGFGEVPFEVARPDGTAFEGCALLAATPEQRAQGLMGRRDLGGYDAMVFRFDEPGSGAFYMFRTVLPLSIAFIDADGGFVSATDMEPCEEEEAAACPTYPAAAPYLHAVEVPQGDLERLGIGPGATVTFGEGWSP